MKPETKKRVIQKIKDYTTTCIILGVISFPFTFFAPFPLNALVGSIVGICVCRYAMSLIEQPKTHNVKKIIYYYNVVGLWINILVLTFSIIGLIKFLINE